MKKILHWQAGYFSEGNPVFRGGSRGDSRSSRKRVNERGLRCTMQTTQRKIHAAKVTVHTNVEKMLPENKAPKRCVAVHTSRIHHFLVQTRNSCISQKERSTTPISSCQKSKVPPTAIPPMVMQLLLPARILVTPQVRACSPIRRIPSECSWIRRSLPARQWRKIPKRTAGISLQAQRRVVSAWWIRPWLGGNKWWKSLFNNQEEA